MTKKILYIDMDNVIVDFKSGLDRVSEELRDQYRGDEDEIPGIFSHMDPMPGAIEAVKQLGEMFDLYILSTAPWRNPSAWSDKLEWVHKNLGYDKEDIAHKRLILSHHKNLNIGNFLIDDRPNNGAWKFGGEWVHFGDGRNHKTGTLCDLHSEHTFLTWADVVNYLGMRR